MQYIVVEGLDYSGKTYFINEIEKMFSKILRTSEPFSQTNFGNGVKEIIRSNLHNKEREIKILLKNREIGFSVLEYQIKEYIRKNNELDVLISDRNFLTTLVYQCETEDEMRDVINDTFNSLNYISINCIPDVIYYLEVPFELALERSIERGIKNNLDEKVLFIDVYEKMQCKYRLALKVLKEMFPDIIIHVIEDEINSEKLNEIRMRLYTNQIKKKRMIK